MPELPEVETVKTILKRKVLNKTIKDIKIFHDNIIFDMTPDKFRELLLNKTLQDITRRAKWLIFDFGDYMMLSHLRMEGKYFYKEEDSALSKHDHLVFYFTDGTHLRYNDLRKFGKMTVVKKEDLSKLKYLEKLGPEANKLDYKYLKEALKNKNKAIKALLLDQTFAGGIGNIYADEILFASKINPYKRGKDLTKKQIEALGRYSKIILDEAVALGGTTIKSYQAGEGIRGHFQSALKVHTKEGEACPSCKGVIIKVRIGGRSTYYCPSCQK